MFDIQATLRPHPDTPDPAQAGIAARDNRPVTPRRPLRLTSARTADAPAAAPPVANIFNGVFDIEERPTDPRLQRSRTRARNLLAAHEASLPPSQRNLWHDDDLPEAPPVPQPQRGSGRPSRRVRHLTRADLSARLDGTSAVPCDPLRDRLASLRHALYAPDVTSGPMPVPANSLPNRLTAQVLNMALLTVALPVGAMVATITLLRGEDIAFSARAVALVGTVTAFLHLTPLPDL